MACSNVVTIVDYGMGNIGSLTNMFRRIGVQSEVVSDLRSIERARKIMLPGVGAFGAAIERIDALGLREVLRAKALEEEVPFMGICLGMQLLTRSSEESPSAKGLDLIPADTLRFPRASGLKVPHMGWNVAQPNTPSPLTEKVGEDPSYYFVHSYCVHVADPAHSLMRTRYGIDFDSAIGRDNIYGVQFHPEKSHRFGMQILKNFAGL
jgi:glutamine amidotransferase